MDIKAGDQIRNNDPRANGQTVVISRVLSDSAMYYARPGGRINYIRLDRVFTDGKKRSQGWNLVVSATEPA